MDAASRLRELQARIAGGGDDGIVAQAELIELHVDLQVPLSASIVPGLIVACADLCAAQKSI